MNIKKGLTCRLERESKRLRWTTECDYSLAFQASSLGAIQQCAVSLLPVKHTLSRITLGLLCSSTSEKTLLHLCVSSLRASCPAAVPLKRTPLKRKQRRWRCHWTKHLEVLCSKSALLTYFINWFYDTWDDRWTYADLIPEWSVNVSDFSASSRAFSDSLPGDFRLLSFSCTYLDGSGCVHSFGETKSTHNSWGLFLKCQPACWQDQVVFFLFFFLMLHMQPGGRGGETGLIGIRCNFSNCFGSWWLTIQNIQAEHLPRQTLASADLCVWRSLKEISSFTFSQRSSTEGLKVKRRQRCFESSNMIILVAFWCSRTQDHPSWSNLISLYKCRNTNNNISPHSRCQ